MTRTQRIRRREETFRMMQVRAGQLAPSRSPFESNGDYTSQVFERKRHGTHTGRNRSTLLPGELIKNSLTIKAYLAAERGAFGKLLLLA
jgi:hypothetical protein